jgi:hypothetical protein
MTCGSQARRKGAAYAERSAASIESVCLRIFNQGDDRNETANHKYTRVYVLHAADDDTFE